MSVNLKTRLSPEDEMAAITGGAPLDTENSPYATAADYLERNPKRAKAWGAQIRSARRMWKPTLSGTTISPDGRFERDQWDRAGHKDVARLMDALRLKKL